MSQRPEKSNTLQDLAPLAPELALALAAVSSDVAMVIDSSGVIRNVSVGNPKLSEATRDWVGRHWSDTVATTSRGKVEQLIGEASSAGLARRREVNLMADGSAGIPIAYSAIRLGDDGPLIAAGRDLRAIAAIQQHFIQTQQDLEQSYWIRRQNEARYRLLFQVATDAVLVVDALSLQVVEANPAAAELLGSGADLLVDSEAQRWIEPPLRPAFTELLVAARTTGRPSEIRTRLAHGSARVAVAATPFRADNTLLLMVRVRPMDALDPSGQIHPSELVEKMPDAVVVTDSNGAILMSNPAFSRLCAAGSSAPLKGRHIESVLAELEPHMAHLVGEARRRGLAGPVLVSLRSADLGALRVEVVATMLDEGDQECIGLKLRILRSEPPPLAQATDELSRALGLLLAQLGEQKLDQLVDRAARLVQKHLLGTALERADGDRSAAARTLGISLTELEGRLFEIGLEELSLPGPSQPSGFLN
ncbi:MAG: transcriptional regulator PpsR [Hydrogenophaga sp.]